MHDILIVTTPSGFFAQNKMPWSSMDVGKVTKYLESEGCKVTVVDFDYLRDNLNGISGKIILYTSSQRVEHKKYIEDVIFLLQKNNILVPGFEAFMAHDNKGFQTLLDKKYGLNLIPAKYYSDISEVQESVEFPSVFKPANGASSLGVTIVNNMEQLKKANNDVFDYSLRDLKQDIKKHLFPWRYNSQWEEYISFGKRRFVLQKFLPGLKHDFKVLIFGEKYYVLKRYVAKDDFRASGSGIHSRDLNLNDNELLAVLNEAAAFKSKFKSHIYSLDICVSNSVAYIIEFQFTHVGPVTLSESEYYFTYTSSGVWEKITAKSNLEDEFSLAVLGYINESSSSCS